MDGLGEQPMALLSVPLVVAGELGLDASCVQSLLFRLDPKHVT